MDIQVGDRVTFKDGIVKLIYDSDMLFEINQYINGGGTQILRIERPKYEVVEENKELLTDDEREFLNFICKYYKKIKIMNFREKNITILDENHYILGRLIYPENLNFDKVGNMKEYTLKELGVEYGNRRI